jgi:drug/metabolite transporter (DMT)-like permease
VAALWGGPYALIKVAVDDLDPITLAAARLAIGSLTLLPLALRSGAFAGLRQRLRWVVVLGVVELAVPFSLIGAGEERIPSSLTGLLVAAVPLILAIATLGDPAERGGPLRLFGVVTGFAGVGVLLGFDLPAGRHGAVGAAMVLLACVGYAIGGLLLRYRFRGTRPEGVMAAAMAVGAAATIVPGTLAAGGASPDAASVAATVVLGIGPTGLAFYLFAVLNAEIGPARASVVAYIAPVFALALGVGFFDEPVGPATIFGLVLILAGSRLAARG